MAGKKIASVEDALKNFTDVMNRSSLKNYVYVNNIMVAKNPKGKTVLIIPEQELWLKIIDDTDFKPAMRELDLTKQYDEILKPVFSYGEDLDNPGWIELDAQSIYNGEVCKIKLDKFDYEISINKNLIPFKLKKAEANNIYYRIFDQPGTVIGVKKKFDPVVPDSAFTIIRLLKVL